MKYYFLAFELDTEIKELTHRSTPVPLTRQGFNLLSYLLQNNHKIHNKDELIAQVWQGRIVSDNTIDQSISKLRKVLNEFQKENYIEAIYGQGIKFIPEVSLTTPAPKNVGFNWLWTAIPVFLVLLLGWYLTQNTEKPIQKPQILVVPSADTDSWVQSGTEQMLSQMLNYSGMATVIGFDEKPRFVDQSEFLENQLKLKPALQTISTQVTDNQGQYQLTISLSTPVRDITEVFNGTQLGVLMAQALDWIQQQINPQKTHHLATFGLPNSDHVTELYMRAMDSLKNNDFEKSRKQLDLISEEEPSFYLAKFQLAQVLSLENKHDEALAILDTLLQLSINDELSIAAQSLKAYIFDTLGDYDAAISIYNQLFGQFQNHQSLALLKARYEYSYVLLNTNQIEPAKQQLNDIILQLKEAEQVSLLADVKALLGSLLQRQGQVEEAKYTLSEALDLFERNDDALGAAKTYSALARIANQQANYQLAESYLNESLAITQSVGFQLGEGATLNELAYVMMVQGQHNKAKQLVKQLDQIAIEIEYPAMQMAAKQLFFDMAREQKDWQEAQRQLQQHHQIATATNNSRALIKNQMLALSMHVDAQQLEPTAELINALQQHIDEQNEIRMQPRLDWLKARIYWQQNNQHMAKQLLAQAKTQAQTNEDGEALININNTLASIYLSNNQADQALSVLNESAQFKPFALPYLKLKAQALQAKGETIKALETMNLCQQQAADLWTPDETAYLKQLVALAQASSQPGPP